MRHAALSSSHRAQAFPAFVIRPTHRFSPELRSPGTTLRYAWNSRAKRKHVMSLMVATSAPAVIGPMLSAVISNVNRIGRRQLRDATVGVRNSRVQQYEDREQQGQVAG
jgi:hypothetical protein